LKAETSAVAEAARISACLLRQNDRPIHIGSDEQGRLKAQRL
jgi:hypothetical protein